MLDGGKRYSGTDNLEATEGALHYQRFLTRLIAQLGSTVPAGAPLLDFGAGLGTYARHARALGYRVLCVDLDDQLRSVLGAEGFEVAGDLQGLAARSQWGIYSFNVLEHIKDDLAALRDIFRVTAPGGCLLLYVPAFPVLFSALDRHASHERRYRRRELVSRTEAAGFTVDRCVYADSLGFPISLLYRLASRHGDGTLSVGSVQLYDRVLFPASQFLDFGLRHFFGKNLVLTAHRPLA